VTEQSAILLLLTVYTSLTANQTAWQFIKPARATPESTGKGS
jgi:hypothetical protein